MQQISLSEVELAYKDCLINKENTISALRFSLNQESEMIDLYNAINNRTYQPGTSIYFVATKPKYREVFAADFKDRVVHHLLINRIKDNFYAELTEHPYSCIKNRGTHIAVNKLKSYLKASEMAYYLQIDIKSFFPSIDKEILFNLVSKYTIDEVSEYLAKVFIWQDPTVNCIYRGNTNLKAKVTAEKSLFSLPKNKGLAIGNYTSQFFANIYLHGLDQFIANDLGIKKYIRYVDDLVLIDESREKLLLAKAEIAKYLQTKLLQCLAESKTKLRPVSNGIDFLGYFVKIDYTLVRTRVKKNFAKKLVNLKSKCLTKFSIAGNNYVKIDFTFTLRQQISGVIGSYLGHFKLANAKHLTKQLFASFPWLTFYYINLSKMQTQPYLQVKKTFSNLYEQYNWFLSSLPNCVLFFPVGVFYEAYDKQAVFLHQQFNFKLRNYHQKLNVGFPINKKQFYGKKLLEQGYTIAILEVNEDIEDNKVKKRFLESIVTLELTDNWNPLTGGKVIDVSHDDYINCLLEKDLLEKQYYQIVSQSLSP